MKPCVNTIAGNLRLDHTFNGIFKKLEIIICYFKFRLMFKHDSAIVLNIITYFAGKEILIRRYVPFSRATF